MSTAPLRVGLVGAGPWARLFHVPLLEDHTGVQLAGVWARDPARAAELVGADRVAASYDDLLAGVDAVAFAVPPDVQARLAPRAAVAGRHLLLEKPLGFTPEQAERVAAAAAGVTSLVMLRTRFDPAVVALEEWAGAAAPRGATLTIASGGALPGSDFATPWRIERGALDDIGPHALDLLDAVLGPVVGVEATGDPRRWVALTTTHASGAVGQAALSITTPLARGVVRLAVYGEGGVREFDAARDADEDATRRGLLDELVAAVGAGRTTRVDAARGLYVQRLVELARG